MSEAVKAVKKPNRKVQRFMKRFSKGNKPLQYVCGRCRLPFVGSASTGRCQCKILMKKSA